MAVGQNAQTLFVFDGDWMSIEEAIDIEVVLILPLHIFIRTSSPYLLLSNVTFLLTFPHTLLL